MTDALARCRREQAEAKAYLDGPGEDKAGAWMAVTDWLMEEAILFLEMERDEITNRPA